ncbi:hypothetical protein B7463_g6809, partial [Scytalidium lignicola]
MITGIAHINLTVPVDTLQQAEEFYSQTLGLQPVPVPVLQKSTLAWFDITPGGQQIHIAFGLNEPKSSRHPCFKLESLQALLQLQKRIWDHHVAGGEAAPLEADKPGEDNSGAKGIEYKNRFFARDYAGNRLEFSL